MLNIFKNKVTLTAPVSGRSVTLSNVPDKVFSSGMMGQEIAFDFDTETIYAPCAGEVTMVPKTAHAVGIKAGNKVEILLHIGLDTVNLNGKGFTMLVNVGDHIKLGDPLVKIDRNLITSAGYNLITMMLVTNSADFKVDMESAETVIAGKTEVITIEK